MLPSVKTIFVIVLLNVVLFSISAGLSSFFGTAAFVEGGLDDELVYPEFPDISFDSIESALTGIWDVVIFIADSVSLFISIMTFDIEGLPDSVRFVLVTPLIIANFYLLFSIFVRLVEVIGGWIPFT